METARFETFADAIIAIAMTVLCSKTAPTRKCNNCCFLGVENLLSCLFHQFFNIVQHMVQQPQPIPDCRKY